VLGGLGDRIGFCMDGARRQIIISAFLQSFIAVALGRAVRRTGRRTIVAGGQNLAVFDYDRSDGKARQVDRTADSLAIIIKYSSQVGRAWMSFTFFSRQYWGNFRAKGIQFPPDEVGFAALSLVLRDVCCF
jgi:hypothetical protein